MFERMMRHRRIRGGLALLLLLSVAAATPAMAQPELVVPELDQTAGIYKQQATADVDRTVAGVEQLLAALQNKDVAAARQAWIDAHAAWERCEIFSDTLFPDLDRQIDGWPDTSTGFHAVEIKLFGSGGDLPVAETQNLLADLTTFRDLFGRQDFSGHMVMVGLALVAAEIGENNGKDGESVASGTSLNDLQHNLDGVILAWNTVMVDYVATRTPHDAKDIAKQLDAVRTLVSVKTLDQIDPAILAQQSEALAAAFADVAIHIGWRRPVYHDKD